MYFSSTVEGPLDVGAMMVAFMEVYDKNGDLFNPPDGQVRVQTGAGDFLVFLHPGDKGTGKCEFAPLMGQRAKYMFRMESTAGEIWSDWAVCDLALPFADPEIQRQAELAQGQFHKSFYVRFHEQRGEPPPPPPPPPPDPRIAELEAALRDQRRRWSVLRQMVERRAGEAMAAIDQVLGGEPG